jgi:hypothetical protein
MSAAWGIALLTLGKNPELIFEVASSMKKRDGKHKKVEGFIKEKDFNAPPIPMAGRGVAFVVERLIQDAMVEGKFSNLANEGKPIKIEEDNPYVEPDMRLAYKVLENARCVPPWIEMDKEVEASIAQVRQERENHRIWLKHRLYDLALGPTQHFLSGLRQLSVSHEYWLQNHARKLTELNQRIHAFNQICPVNELLKIPMQVDKVIQEYDKSCPAIPKV